MSIFLEITQLENGDIVLREAEDEEPGSGLDSEPETVLSGGIDLAQAAAKEPLVRISFSNQVKDMLGGDLVGVAEAMIDAATDFLDGDAIEVEAETVADPVIH